ncbi:iron-siderophore ABC transporter substrate-binding protein [Devosia nitrariae]|uniref:Periplasmic binding protein n=1 Tax=Devosia nitrariae TaxID=2071872 RepID=A0ABQ5WDM9_9HYPH|nr:iron-siderophore ABC transporter substrate-binding protein [Devosia nitrariae]GLQ57896.1 periplasmic binding protein [Devosia nitrariae]
MMFLRRLATVGVVVVLNAGAQAENAFPVTLEHVYGATILERAPQRIVTWGWGNEDAAIALGVIPVAMPFQSYGGGEDGVQPWIEEALAAMGAAKPMMLDNSGEPPVEQIAALAPDLIIAAYSGITQEQYALLSSIAPTIAYKGEAWSRPWQEVTRVVGKAIGKPEEAETLVAETEQWLDGEVAKYPALKDVTFAGANDYGGSIAVYAPFDARMKFLTDLGLKMAPSVAALAPSDGEFYYSLSYELFDELETDIFVTYYEEEAALDAFLAKPYAQTYPPIQNGGLAALVGTENVAAVSPPSALSLRWGFATYLSVLAKAANNVTN